MTSTAAPLHIFKPGRHTAMGGESLSFSEIDLQATVAAYDPTKHEAPLVIGHPQHDMPAYGWVQSLSYCDGDEGSGLYAMPAQVNPDFADMVAGGAFKKISAAFYGPNSPNNPVPGVYYLRHVGFLGAQPPAVKGLRNPAFADDEPGVVTVEFGEDEARPETGTPSPSFSQQEESTVTEEEAARLRAENEQLKAAAAQAKRDQVHAGNVAFCDALVAEGRLLPAAKGVIVATLDHLASQDTPLEFGEGNAKAPLIDSLKATLKTAPQAVRFGEQATPDAAAVDGEAQADVDDAAFAESADPQRLKQHQAIKAHMAQHKVDYATAAAAVLR